MELLPVFSEDEIRAAVQKLGARISADYRDRCPLLIGVLKGSFVFLADLVRELSVPLEIDFVRARSYGAGLRSSGAVEIAKDLEADLRDRHVIVVEDIADTGLTMDVVVGRLRARQPASIKRCALLLRNGCPEPDYFGLRCGPEFVVGYGTDYAERHRGLRDIRAIPGTGNRAE